MKRDAITDTLVPVGKRGWWHATRSGRVAAAMATTLTFACAALCVAPAVASEQPRTPSVLDDLGPLLAMDEAVAAVAYRLSVASTPLCPRHAPLSGMLIHSLAQYGPRLRMTAARTLGLDDRPSVEWVVPGGPADQADLRAGDILLAIAGKPVGDTPLGRPRSAHPGGYAVVARARAQLNDALGAGSADVRVERAGHLVDVILHPIDGCEIDAEVSPSEVIGASANEDHVFVNTALIEDTRSNAELATVISHEMGHAILRMRRLALGMRAEHSAGLGAGRREEAAADEIGLYLMARAGYDLRAASAFWQRFRHDHPLLASFSLSHPDALDRAQALEHVRMDILQREREGEPLVPPELLATPITRP